MARITSLDRTARAAGAFGLAAVLFAPATASAQPVSLGSAESFAVLAGTSVTNTGASAIAGDLGVYPGDLSGFPPGLVAPGGSIHVGDGVAVQAQGAADVAYSELAALACPATNLLVGDLGGLTLPPGVYCVAAAATLTGPLTLTGAGPWTFQIGGDLTTADGSAVVVQDSTAACDGSSVFWQVAGTASLGASSAFVGSLLTNTDATLGAGATVDGRVIAPHGTASLNTNAVTACSSGATFPFHAPVKVTGGGQIDVPSPDSTDPDATGDGRANYGFNAHPPASAAGAATGHLNYLNHVTRLHGRGTVNDLDVLSLDTDGAPKLVRFSGTCDGVPDCTFSVTVEDNGEPGHNDRFGITIVRDGVAIEARAARVVGNGNIQVHESLSTTVNAASFDAGDVMQLSATLAPGSAPGPVDVYLVLRLPGGQLLSWTGSGFRPGIVPILRNVTAAPFSGVVLQVPIPADAPKGTYTWLSALTTPGTLSLLTAITESTFVIR